MKDPFIFKEWINKAFRDVVKQAIKTLSKDGLSHQHSFYITFNTTHKKVVLSKALKEKYDGLISIILENQFENLEYEEDGFFVSLSFHGTQENVYVPFDAIVFFQDNSINLNLILEPKLGSKKASSKGNTNEGNIIMFPKK